MENFKVNKCFFSNGGVLGRLDYFYNCYLKTIGLLMLAGIPYGFGSLTKLKLIGGMASASLTIVIIFFSFTNTFKRLRDIRATTENQTLWQTILAFSFFIPVVSFFIPIYLLCAKGKITSDESEGNELKKTMLKKSA